MYLSTLKMMIAFPETGLYSPWVDEPAFTLPSSDKKIVAQKSGLATAGTVLTKLSGLTSRLIGCSPNDA